MKTDKTLTPQQAKMVAMLLGIVPDEMLPFVQLRIGKPPHFKYPGDHDCDDCMHSPCDCPLDED